MSWLSFGGSVAVVVLATSVAVACGDSTSITIVEAADGGSEAAPDAQVGQPPLPDAGNDSSFSDAGDAGDGAMVDGGDDGAVACATAPIGAVNADDCSVESACPFACSTKTPWVRYTCAGAGERPSIFGCVAGGPGGGTCCPPMCVRTASKDGTCASGAPMAYSCPRSADGGALFADPPAGCLGPYVGSAPSDGLYCCP